MPRTYLGSQVLFHSELEELGNRPIKANLKLPEFLLNHAIEIPSKLDPEHPVFENLRNLIHEINVETSNNPETIPPLERIRNFYQTYIQQACFPKISVDTSISLFDTAENSNKIAKYALEKLPLLKNIYNDPTHPEVIRCLNKIAEVAIAKKEPEKALQFLTDAISLNLCRTKNTHLLEEIACSCTLLASAHLQINKTYLALDESILLFLYRKHLYQIPSPPMGPSVKDLANAYHSQANQNRIIENILMANAAIETTYGLNTSSELGLILCKTGIEFWNQGQEEAATESITKALRIFQSCRSEQLQPSVAVALKDMGIIYQDVFENVRALECFKKSLEILRTHFPEQPHPKMPSILKKIGFSYKELNQNEFALGYLFHAYEMEKKLRSSPFHPKIAAALRAIGLFQLELRIYPHAQMSLISAKNLLDSWDPSQEHPDFPVTYNALASFYNKVGTEANEVKDFEQAGWFLQMAIHLSKEALTLAKKLNQADALEKSLSNLEEAHKKLTENNKNN